MNHGYADTIERQHELLRAQRLMLAQLRSRHWATSTNNVADFIAVVPSMTPFWITKEIAQVVWDAAATIPDTFVLTPDLLPEPRAFLWADQPWLIPPITSDASTDDRKVLFWTIQGMAWQVNDRQSGQSALLIYNIPARNDRKSDHSVLASELPWPFGFSIAELCSSAQALEHVRFMPDFAEGTIQQLRFFASLLLFMNQRIVVTQMRHLPRAMSRRLQRANKTQEIPPGVHVIELRRREYETVEREGQPVSRDYAMQWIVRGHWRNQWYPSRGRHHPKWIVPYVKGPADKPLKAPRVNVFEVTR